MKRNDINVTEEEKYGLTPKQMSFCKEYLRTNDVVGSYKSCYNTNASPNSISGQAYKVYNNPKVQAYLREMTHQAEMQARAENRDIMDTVDVLEWLSNIIRSESRSIKIAERIRAAELILKANGAFIQKIEADVKSINDIIINITDNEEDED